MPGRVDADEQRKLAEVKSKLAGDNAKKTMEALNQVRVLRTEDAKEAISAFFEKRKPKFSGR